MVNRPAYAGQVFCLHWHDVCLHPLLPGYSVDIGQRYGQGLGYTQGTFCGVGVQRYFGVDWNAD